MNNMRHIIITVCGKLGLRWIWPRIEHRNAQFYTFSKAFLILPESAQSNYQGVKSLFHSYFRDILIMLDTSIYLSICMPICMSICMSTCMSFPFFEYSVLSKKDIVVWRHRLPSSSLRQESMPKSGYILDAVTADVYASRMVPIMTIVTKKLARSKGTLSCGSK